MKLSMTPPYGGDPRDAAKQAADLESAGIDMLWVAELYSFDAVSILGYLAVTPSEPSSQPASSPSTPVHRRSRR